MAENLTYPEALNRLESELLTPIVPGELERSLEAISQAADLVSALLWRHTENLKNTEYPAIAAQDPELLAQTDRLMQGDADCVERLAALLDQIARLKNLAPKCEPNEAVMRNSLESLIQQGLKWVIDAKRQEKARETWFVEAFQRDRGVGD
jgi:hypothetical protein